jgi:hypothetical protein
VLPIIYGEDVVGPIISLAKVIGNELVLRCLWCLGEVEEVVKVTLDDGTVPTGMVMTHYVGRSDQQPDPYLAAHIAGYADSCVVPIGVETFGVCYSVIRVQARTGVGFPRLLARIKGRKVRDPRGINFYSPTIDGDFSAGLSGRARIGYDGTYHLYTKSPNTRASTTAALFSNSAVGSFLLAFKPTAAAANEVFLDLGGGKLQVIWKTGNFIQVVGKNAASTTVLDCTSNVSLDANVDHSVAISWDINQNLCTIITDGVNSTPVSYVATSGQTINLAATGQSICSTSAGLNPFGGYVSGIGFDTRWIDLRDGINGLPSMLDALGRILYPPWNGISGFWFPIGYAGSPFTYASVPATVNDPGSTWSTVGTVDRNRFTYPGVGGGLFYQNAVGDASFILKANGNSVQAQGGVAHGIYIHGIQYAGSTIVNASASGVVLTLTGTGDQDAVTSIVPSGTGENFTIKAVSPTSVRLKQFYLFPEPNLYATRFQSSDLSGDWTVTSGTVTLADPIIGGASSTAGTLTKNTPLFVPGEEVFYSFEISGALFGSVTVSIGGVPVVANALGLYSGSVTAVSTAVSITWATVGAAVIKSLSLETETAAKVYTKTPALVLADLIESRAYGLGGTVNDSSLLEACKFNEELLYENGTARHEIGLTLVERNSITSWIETLRAYSRCYIAPRGSEYVIVPDTATNSVGSIGPGDMISGTFKPQKKSLRNLPNVVKVYYTNTAVDPWTEDFVEAVAPIVQRGQDYRRESSIRMPGIQSRSMAYRFAIERLNDSTLIDLQGSFTAKDKAWKYEVGDVITITHPIGLTDKAVRILGCDPGQRGEVNITFSEYDPNVYSDAIVDDPPPPDYGGGSPFEVPPITGLRLEETFFVSGGTVGSQLEISWNDINYAFLMSYIVEIYEVPPRSLDEMGSSLGGVLLPDNLRNITGTDTFGAGGILEGEAETGDGQRVVSYPPGGRLLATIRTPDIYYNFRPLSIGSTYYIKVYAQSVTYNVGPAAEASLTAQGYLLPPDFSQGQIVAFEAGDAIDSYVKTGAIDIDLWGYEFRYREVSDQNLATKWGPQFSAGDFGGSTSQFVITPHLLQFNPTTTSDVTIHAPDTGIVVGKSYDVYVKINKFNYPVSNPGVGLGIGGNGTPYIGSFSGFIWLGSDITTPGIYKSRRPWTPEGNSDIYLGSHGHATFAAAGTCFEIEYVAFRETEGGTDTSGNLQLKQVEDDWETAALIQRAATTACRVPSLPSGGYLVYCKALDSQRSAQNPYGQYSVDTPMAFTRIQVDNTGTSRLSFQLTTDLAITQNVSMYPKPTLSGLTFEAYGGAIETYGLYAPDDGATWNSTITGPLNSVTSPVWGQFEGASPEIWGSVVYDLGRQVNGTVRLIADFASLGPGANPNNVSINIQAANNPAMFGFASNTVSGPELINFTGRYLRVVMTFTGNKVGFKMSRARGARLEVTVIPRTESGTGTTLGPDGSGNPQPVTVRTANSYTLCSGVRAWAAASEPVSVYVDNVTLGRPASFTVIAVDQNGIPVAVPFSWEWKGV